MPEIQLSKKYTENNISDLILKLNFAFRVEGKLLKNYRLQVDISEKDFTGLSALIIYKFISFVLDNSCLEKPSSNSKLLTLFSKFHLEDLLRAYLGNKEKELEKLYSKITPFVKEDFFIAPHPISRTEISNHQSLEKNYYETIKKYYKDYDDGVIDCIKTCIVEISSNFYYHANDSKSILMSEGNQNRVEIVSVDTSQGIIATMRERYTNKTDVELLKMAFKRRVSSKLDGNHCGTGLWLVNEIVTKLKGKLIMHTGGYVYRNIQGKISIFASSYWKGSVLYVKIPISNDISFTLESIFENDKNYLNN